MPSVRFTTGTIRVEPDRKHVTLPRLGTLKTHESTRKLERRLADDRARPSSRARTSGRWTGSKPRWRRNVHARGWPSMRQPVAGSL